jgi:hypothetical protein
VSKAKGIANKKKRKIDIFTVLSPILDIFNRF